MAIHGTSRYLIALMFCIAGVSSCAGPAAKSEDRGYVGQDAGAVMLSLGISKATKWHTVMLQYDRVGSGTRPMFSKDRSDPAIFNEGAFGYVWKGFSFQEDKPDYDDSAESGIVIFQSLPPGDYVIQSVQSSIGNHTYASNIPFAIPFTVKSGRTTYIGSFEARMADGSNFFGMTVPAGPYFFVRNRFGTDSQLAARKKTLITSQIDMAIPDTEALRSPYFR